MTYHRVYRREIRVFTSARGSSSNSSTKSLVQLTRVFVLFIETGFLYVIFFVRSSSLFPEDEIELKKNNTSCSICCQCTASSTAHLQDPSSMRYGE